MQMTGSKISGFNLTLDNEAATQRFAADVANMLEPGDFIALSGDLGAGKTAFARALIAYLAGDAEIEVPSPSFTLVQTYDLPRFTLLHADLYRVTSAGELAELGVGDIPDAVVLLEWPDRAAGALPADRIDIAFMLNPQYGPDYRAVHVSGQGTAAARVNRLGAMLDFIRGAGLLNTARTRIAGDASSRSYERLSQGGESAILMNAPRHPDGPPVKRGLSYSAIAHIAEDVKAFVAIANGLRERGFSAPRIYASELDSGFLLQEDLGTESVIANEPRAPIAERYERATDVLVALHDLDLPAVLPVAPYLEYHIPPYDLDAYLIETELLLDWYLPYRGAAANAESRALFLSLWREALRPAIEAPRTWVLRDFHSPNLMWMEGREGIAQIGLLDFQDTVMGPAAYDLASLLQDARVDVPEELEITLYRHYVRARRAADQNFDVAVFGQLYATMAAQRATKVLGIFTRLDRRDRKPQYLRHLPRVYASARRSLRHPALAALGEWYLRHVPPP